MKNFVILTPEIFKIDAQQLCAHIEIFIKEKFTSSHFDGIVVPISGGLDSSVVAALCARSIGKDKVTGLMLPERLGNPDATHYGWMIAAHLGIKTVKINISPVLRGLGASNLFMSAISGREIWKGMVNRHLGKRNQTAEKLYIDTLRGLADLSSRKLIAQVSAKQRVRLLTTYKYAEENNLMVAGSAHKTEQMVGLFVKYGVDDGADLMPLKNIYRSQTLQLAEYLEIPSEILHRSPNPDILPGITDKYLGYFGLDYLQVELILVGHQKGLSADEIANQIGLDEQVVRRMFEIVQLSERYRSHAEAPELMNDKGLV
jgi:NAD+ synthase